MPEPNRTGSMPRDPATAAGGFILNGENAFAQTAGILPLRNLPADIAIAYKTAHGQGAQCASAAPRCPAAESRPTPMGRLTAPNRASNC